MKTIQDNSIIKRNGDIVFNKLDDEIVMMSIKNGQYYGLDEIATSIYEMTETPVTFGNLIAQLLEHFDIDEKTCRKDVEVFLLQLESKEIVIIE